MKLFAPIMAIALLIAPGLRAAEALSARLTAEGGRVVLAVELSEALGFRAFTVAEPERVIVDFPDLSWRFDPLTLAEDAPLVTGLRLGFATLDTARLVVDLKAPARIAEATVTDTDAGAVFRLVLARSDAAAFQASAGWPDADAKNAEAEGGPPVPILRPKRGVVVAIDAGHGGRDSGATHGDLMEKDLVLRYAVELARELKKTPGVHPYLVRKGDEFIRLRDRVRRARRANADVLISLHADALEQGAASGASVFLLSDEASNDVAAELVESHDRADVIAGVPLDAEEGDLVSVLVDLARRDTDRMSRSLAESVVVALSRRDIELEGRALQSAAFRVLKAPDVPSILVEIGFLSAKKDRARLTTNEGRREVIEALAEGVLNWLEARKAAEAAGNDG